MYVPLPLLALAAAMLPTLGFAAGIVFTATMVWLGFRNAAVGPNKPVRWDS